MQHFIKLNLIPALCMASFILVGCQHHAEEHHAEHPAEVEHIEGSEISRVTYTEKAMERIDVHLGEVMTKMMSGVERTVVPYSSVIYDPHGDTWIYTSPSPRTFVRESIDIDYIDGDTVVLNDGPPAGTTVATVGVAEIYGTEFEVGH